MNKSKKGKHNPVWNFFEIVDGYSAKCIICSGVFSYKTTTFNLRKHILRKHSTLPAIHSTFSNVNTAKITKIASQQSQVLCISHEPKQEIQPSGPSNFQIKLVPTQKLIPNQLINTSKHFQFQQSPAAKKRKKEKKSILNETEDINDTLLQLFIKDFQPISIVEDEGFRTFIRTLNPSYEIPSKKYISQNLLPSLYEKCYINAKEVAKSIRNCCITTECWTSNNYESFLAISVHFINNDFYLKSILISCSLLEENFTSESLAEELNRNIRDWDLQNKIIFSVSSGEEYMANAIKLILKWDHFRCFAHSINKVIGEALNLKTVEELISKVRLVVSFVKNDSIASSELHLSQINCNIEPKKLKQDIPMMWNSTFRMIERFVELENAISSIVVIQETNLPLMQPEEWIVLKELTKILRSLEAVTRASNQENYMLASLPIVLANGLFEICRKLESCDDLSEITKQIILNLKNGFQTRFNELSNNPILSVCTFLDPRFKTIPFDDQGLLVKKRVMDLIEKNINASCKEEANEKKSDVSKTETVEELSVWEVFDKTAANTKQSVSPNSRVLVEVDRYIQDDLINRNSDPLEWWKIYRHNYPLLSELVSKVFCSLATSIPCNQVFSKSGNITIDRRLKLSSSKLKQLIFLNANQILLGT